MDEKTYNKISQAYQVLSNRFSHFPSQYADNSKIYSNDFFLFRDNNREFYEQFENMPFGEVHKDSFLENQRLAEKYYASPIITFSDKGVKVHLEFSTYLFHYIIYKLNNLQSFLDVLNSNEFQERFKGFIKIEKYHLSYSLFLHQEIYNFLKDRIENFGLLYHLLHRTNSSLVLTEDNSTMQIKITQLRTILDRNENMFDFKKFEVK